jgi:hypothetical protein
LAIVSDSVVLNVADLRYTELKKDRYAQFKPTGNASVPLEKMVKLHTGKSWQAKFIQVNDRINKFLEDTESAFQGNMPSN